MTSRLLFILFLGLLATSCAQLEYVDQSYLNHPLMNLAGRQTPEPISSVVKSDFSGGGGGGGGCATCAK